MAKITSYRGKGIGGCGKKKKAGAGKRRVSRAPVVQAAPYGSAQHPKRMDKIEMHHAALQQQAQVQQVQEQAYDPGIGWYGRPAAGLGLTMGTRFTGRYRHLRGKSRRPLTLTARRNARTIGYY